MTRPRTLKPLAPGNSHQRIDVMDLEMHRLMAAKIRRQPRLFGIALRNLRRWREMGGYQPPVKEWQQIVDSRTRAEVLELIAEDSEEGNRLRQNSPFCGVLTKGERLTILDKYYAPV
jgi:hypothetical protein